MLTSRIHCAVLLVLLSLVASEAAAQTGESSPFVGEWRNLASWTRGIVRIDIHQTNGRFFVQVWGRCHPSPCDWGEVVADVFIAQTTWKPVALRTEYKQSDGTKTQLYLRIDDATGRLRAETYTDFLDSRPAYWAAYFLTRGAP